MHKFYKNLILLVLLNLFTFSIFASSLEGVKVGLKNIDKQIIAAVKYAEKLYEENQGAVMSSSVNILEPNNVYLHSLSVSRDYNIAIEFPELSSGTGVVSGSESSLTKALLGKIIVLIPIKEEGDEVITSWECVTDADENIQEFIGDIGAKIYSKSYIASETKNKYLTNCIYLTKSTIDPLLNN